MGVVAPGETKKVIIIIIIIISPNQPRKQNQSNWIIELPNAEHIQTLPRIPAAAGTKFNRN